MRAWQGGTPEEAAVALRAADRRIAITGTPERRDAWETRFGIPSGIVAAADAIRRELPENEGGEWAARFTAAIAPDADLRHGFATWAAEVLRSPKLRAANLAKRRDRNLVAERYANVRDGAEDETAEWEASFTTLFELDGDQLAMHACRPQANAALAAESMVATIAAEGGSIHALADALIHALSGCGTAGENEDETAAETGAPASMPGTFRVTVYASPGGERLGGERRIEARTALDAAVLAAAAAGATNCNVRTSRAEDDGQLAEIRIRTSMRPLRTVALDP